MERNALLAPVAIGEFGLNLCGGVGWRDGFRPVADPQTYGKLTLNVELAGAARLHRAASVLMDGLELSGAHI